MCDNYVSRLIDCIKNTIIVIYGEKYDYSDGIKQITEIIKSYRQNGSKLFFIGNGGSAAIASHMTADYMKNGGMNTCSLYDDAVLTCLGNDYGYEEVFSRQISKLAQKGDLLVSISSSGKSANICNAIREAQKLAVDSISLTGFAAENETRKLSDISVWVPCDEYGIVESIHTIILQEIVDLIMEMDKQDETSNLS